MSVEYFVSFSVMYAVFIYSGQSVPSQVWRNNFFIFMLNSI